MAAKTQQNPPPEKLMIALNLRDEGKRRFSLRNNMMLEMRQRVNQDKEVDIPVAYQATTQEVRLSLIGDAVALMAAIIDDADWKVHVDPYDVGSTASRNSSLREKASEAMVHQAVRELGRPVLANCAANQMGDGVGVLKVIYRPDHWTGQVPTTKSMFGKPSSQIDEENTRQYTKAVEKAKRGAKLPFTIVDVDPLTWWPFYGPDGELVAVIEMREQRIHEALLAYGDKVAMRGDTVVPIEAMGEPVPYDRYNTASDTGSTVKVWDYWDRDEHIVFIEDLPVRYTKHGMGCVPYFECYSRPSADRDPAVNSRPATYKLMWLEDMINRFYTMMTNVGYQFSYPTPFVQTPAGFDGPVDDTGRPIMTEWEQGKLMRGYPGQKIEFLGVPADSVKMMMELISNAQHQFESSTGLGPAIRGIGGSDQPGYALNQLMQASMLTLNPAIKSRSEMMSRMILYIWRLIEKKVDADIWVWGTDPDPEKKSQKKWLKFGPSDIDGYYRCEVQSKALMTQMKISMGQFYAGMVKAELMDRRRAIEQGLGEEDPDSIIDDIEVDKLLSNGPLHDKLQEQLLRKYNLLPPPPPQAPPDGGMPPGKPPGGGMDMGGLPGAPTGLPPAGPGLGMPLVPPPPPNPGMSEGQMGASMPGGRAAGGDRMPPTQPMPNIGGG